MNKISAVYQIVNTVTNDRYVGSSKDLKSRWAVHKCPSRWKRFSIPLYQDMQKYGLENFRFQILAPVMPEHLKQVEQEFIDMLNPTYNNYRANDSDIERWKESRRKYYQRNKESKLKAVNKRHSQLCSYNGETLTLGALTARFIRAGVEHPTLEAKKYLIN